MSVSARYNENHKLVKNKRLENFNGAKVRQCFEQAVATSRLQKSRYGVPCEEMCDFIADSIAKQFLEIDVPFPDIILGKAQGYAKSFLKHLPAAKANIEEWYLSQHKGGVHDRDSPHLEGIAEIQAAEDAVKALLTRYERKQERPYTGLDLAGWISAYGIKGWRETGRFPKGVEPGGPMNTFVRLVLEALGISVTEDSISNHLRGHRGKGTNKPKVRSNKL